MISSFVALILVTLTLIGRKPSLFDLVTVTIASLGFGPLTSALALGQLALPVSAAVTLAVAIAAKSRVGTSVATFLACAQPNLAIALAALVRSRGASLSAITGAGIFAAACLAVAGTGGFKSYLAALESHSAAERFSAIQITPSAIAYGVGLSGSVALVIAGLIALCAIAAWLWAVMRSRLDLRSTFFVTAALLPFAIPFFHEHDLALLFPAAVIIVLTANSKRAPWALAAALVCATDWLGLAQRPDGVVQTVLLIIGAGTALLALRERLDHAALAVPALVVLITAAGWIAQSHALPVWPDAMRAIAKGGTDIASVWHSELAATELFQRSVFWAALRALSLAGCAGLAYLAVVTPKYRRS